MKIKSVGLILCLLLLVACQQEPENTETQPLSATAVAEVDTPITPTEASTLVPTMTPQPTETPPPAPTQEPQGMSSELAELFTYLPVTIADQHFPVYFGPAYYLIDMAQIRQDLGVPSDITGASERSDKLDLILGLDLQGLSLMPTTFIDPLSGSMFAEWGWDIADIQSALHMYDFKTAVFIGHFDRPEIRQSLLDKGYTEALLEDFDYFTKEGESLEFALKPDTLIISNWEEESFIELLLTIIPLAPGLDTHPSVLSILAELDGVWGVVLAARPDVMEAFGDFEEEIARMPPAYQERFGDIEIHQPNWDFLGIAFQADEEGTNLKFLYHYASNELATNDIELVEVALTETPSLSSIGLTWGDLMQLGTIETAESVLVVHATTRASSLIGDAIENGDSMAFLLIPQNSD